MPRRIIAAAIRSTTLQKPGSTYHLQLAKMLSTGGRGRGVLLSVDKKQVVEHNLHKFL